MKKEIKDLQDKLSCAEALNKEALTSGVPLRMEINPLTIDEIAQIQGFLILRPKWRNLNRGGND